MAMIHPVAPMMPVATDPCLRFCVPKGFFPSSKHKTKITTVRLMNTGDTMFASCCLLYQEVLVFRSPACSAALLLAPKRQNMLNPGLTADVISFSNFWTIFMHATACMLVLRADF